MDKGDKMDKQEDYIKGTDIVTIMCMVVFTILLGVLVANWTVG